MKKYFIAFVIGLVIICGAAYLYLNTHNTTPSQSIINKSHVVPGKPDTIKTVKQFGGSHKVKAAIMQKPVTDPASVFIPAKQPEKTTPVAVAIVDSVSTDSSRGYTVHVSYSIPDSTFEILVDTWNTDKEISRVDTLIQVIPEEKHWSSSPYLWFAAGALTVITLVVSLFNNH